ncbi:MAG: hypothetical protein LC130_25385 [Bryobacterales bacterium]|nr:hypothetical protein [Bryobacterales bacterium]
MRFLRRCLRNLLALFLVSRVRRAVALILVAAVALTVIAPPAKAQIGAGAVISAATAIIRLINNTIGGLLDTARDTMASINGVLTQFDRLWEEVVYPLELVNQTRALVGSMISQYRGVLTGLLQVNVSSAQLANPVALETIIRNRSAADFGQLVTAFRQTYGTIPQPGDAHTMERDLADIDDATALANLKTLKASDAMVDQMMTAANVIEDEGVNMAPGSAPYLAGAGMIASVKSQAMMQRMIAAAIRQEAARVAHDNTIRKRNAMFGAQFRNDVQTMFKK